MARLYIIMVAVNKVIKNGERARSFILSVFWYWFFGILFLTRDCVRKTKCGCGIVNEMDKLFLKMIHDPALREDLLVRLEKLGLLSAFLEIENETIE